MHGLFVLFSCPDMYRQERPGVLFSCNLLCFSAEMVR
nr:MAG TPA: hypothetical protein [Caudoviricetes sp.]